MLGLPGMRRAPRMMNQAVEIVEIPKAMLPVGDLLSLHHVVLVKLFRFAVELSLQRCSPSPGCCTRARVHLLLPRLVERLLLRRVQRLLRPLRLLCWGSTHPSWPW